MVSLNQNYLDSSFKIDFIDRKEVSMNKLLVFALCAFSAVSINLSSVASAQETQDSTTNTNLSIFTKRQQVDHEGIELYRTNLEMKSYKKMGIGLATGGLIGGFGLNAEFNLMPEDALFVGLGRGDAYNSFNLGWKHNFEAEYLSLYTKVGYGKWFNNGAGSGSAKSNDILRRVLTDSEIDENKFSTNFVAGGGGLEYNQLEGNLSGVNFYGEILVLADLRESIMLPTGSVGITYFY